MFQVVHKDHNSLDLDFFENMHTVYDVKKDVDTNQIVFLFFDDVNKWHYVSSSDYRPLGYNSGGGASILLDKKESGI